jgi:hypothetical protein
LFRFSSHASDLLRDATRPGHDAWHEGHEQWQPLAQQEHEHREQGQFANVMSVSRQNLKLGPRERSHQRSRVILSAFDILAYPLANDLRGFPVEPYCFYSGEVEGSVCLASAVEVECDILGSTLGKLQYGRDGAARWVDGIEQATTSSRDSDQRCLLGTLGCDW